MAENSFKDRDKRIAALVDALDVYKVVAMLGAAGWQWQDKIVTPQMVRDSARHLLESVTDGSETRQSCCGGLVARRWEADDLLSLELTHDVQEERDEGCEEIYVV